MVCRYSKVIICLLIGNVFSASQAGSPFPPSPVTMQPYINKSRPNLLLHIDNTATMKNKVPRRYMNLPASQRSRRIDVVKHAAIEVVEKYYTDFNWGVAVYRDKYRTAGWAVDPSQKGGYNQGTRVGGSLGKNPQLLGFEKYLSSTTKFGKQLILPIINNDGSAKHKQDIIDSIKTMYPDLGYMEDAYPDLINYMPSTIQYRCQDT